MTAGSRGTVPEPAPDGQRVALFDRIGLDDASVRVYRTLLLHPGWSIRQIGVELAVEVSVVREALDRLTAAEFLRPSQQDPSVLTPLSPEVAFGDAITGLDRQVARQQEELAELRKAMTSFISEYHSRRVELTKDDLERLEGRDQVLRRLSTLNREVREEFLAFVPNRPSQQALEQARAGDERLLGRGVRVRTIYLESAVQDRTLQGYLSWFWSAGARVRVVPSLPVRLIVLDRSTALIALDPGDPGRGALVLRSPGILSALICSFEDHWSRGVDLFDESGRGDAELTPVEAEVLQLMAHGHKDDSIARRLDVSVRTTRRVVAELREKVGAGSRFELGVIAAERHWI